MGNGEHQSMLIKVLVPDAPIKRGERFLYILFLLAALSIALSLSFEVFYLILVMTPLALVLIFFLIFLTGYNLYAGPSPVRMRVAIWYVFPVIGFTADALAHDGRLAPVIANVGGIIMIILGGLLPLMWLVVSRQKEKGNS